jgi:hypothetical protein
MHIDNTIAVNRLFSLIFGSGWCHGEKKREKNIEK